MTIFAQLGRFGAVGILNTLVAIAVIALMLHFDFGPLAANIAGYAAGLASSYYANRRFTFAAKSKSSKTTFLISFALSYSLNLVVLHASAGLAAIHPLLPQIASTAVYTGTFFILMRIWVFNSVK